MLGCILWPQATEEDAEALYVYEEDLIRVTMKWVGGLNHSITTYIIMIQIQVKSQEDQHQFPFITIADPYLTLTEKRYVWECSIIMTAIHHHWRFWSTLHIYYIWITNNKLDTSSCFLLLFLYCSSLDAGSTHPLLPYNTQQPRVTCFVNWIHQAVGPLFWVSQFTGAGLGLFLLPPAY